EIERAALIRLRHGPDPAPMALHYFFTNGQAEARARIQPTIVQQLSHLEDPYHELFLDTNYNVTHPAQRVPLFSLDSEVHLDWPVGPKLHRVADQVLEQKHQFGLIAHDGGQRIGSYLGTTFFQRCLQVGASYGKNRRAINRPHGPFAPDHT